MLIGDVDREILEFYSEDIAAYHSINQIAKKLGKKYPYVNKRASSLLEQGILKKSVLGNTYLCSVNFSSDSAIALLSLVEIGKRDKAIAKDELLKQLLQQIKEEKRYSNLICVVISGNRLIYVRDGREQISLPRVRGFSSVAVDAAEFSKMLCSEKIAKEHIILLGFEGYFGLVRGVEKELRAQQIHDIA
jgi:DNA-binding Lrp family transcriptional regulator